jgi:hypothetical protein
VGYIATDPYLCMHTVAGGRWTAFVACRPSSRHFHRFFIIHVRSSVVLLLHLSPSCYPDFVFSSYTALVITSPLHPPMKQVNKALANKVQHTANITKERNRLRCYIQVITNILILLYNSINTSICHQIFAKSGSRHGITKALQSCLVTQV